MIDEDRAIRPEWLPVPDDMTSCFEFRDGREEIPDLHLACEQDREE